MGKFLSILFCILISNSILSLAQDCSTYTFTSNKTFATCVSLPVQNSHLHWNYNLINRTLDMAYRHIGVSASTWVAWGLNLDRPAMLGTQALVALQDSSGSERAYTSSVISYGTRLQESGLSFDVQNLRAERVNGDVVIYATLELPMPGMTSFYQVWQSGPVSNGTPGLHSLKSENRNSGGIVNFATGELGGYDGSTPPPSPIQAPGTNSSKTRISMRVLVIVIVIVVITITCTCILIRLRKKQHQTSHTNITEIEAMDIGMTESLRYNFSLVKAATNDFSENCKLGQGGFGAVYKGKLEDGQEIAVKRLAMNSAQGDKEFKNEVLLVAKLQHRNLVRLLGFSIEGSERLLIYEFLQNGSLDQIIFDPTKRTLLEWEKRYNIIKGISKGLLYLHEDSRLRVVHRDMKAGNVLLDSEMEPKIADFGMARLFKPEETQGDTNRIVGTYGYMAPEYAMYGQFSVKSDVFSFGVLVLEMVTSQKNQCFRNGDSIENLPSFAWKTWRNGTPLDVIDPTLNMGPGSLRTVIRSIHIGLLCVQENVDGRPTMASVVHMLNNISVPLPVPSEPAFFMHSNANLEMPLLNEYNSSRSRLTQHSINVVSISEIVPR